MLCWDYLLVGIKGGKDYMNDINTGIFIGGVLTNLAWFFALSVTIWRRKKTNTKEIITSKGEHTGVFITQS